MKCILFLNNDSVSSPYSDFSYYFHTKLGNYYLEPVFLRKLELYQDIHAHQYDTIIIETIKQHLSLEEDLVLCDEVDEAITSIENGKYLGFRDIIDLAKLPINDISRGSDYGD
jgi:hypothetical protein